MKVLNYTTLYRNWTEERDLKDIENLAIILVPLIMILSRGHTGQIKGLSLLGDYDFLTGGN